MATFVPLYEMTENDRIKLIGESVMKAPSSSADKPPINAFIVENQAKAERYIRKLKRRFPAIRIIEQLPDTPAPGLITVKVGPPLR